MPRLIFGVDVYRLSGWDAYAFLHRLHIVFSHSPCVGYYILTRGEKKEEKSECVVSSSHVKHVTHLMSDKENQIKTEKSTLEMRVGKK